MLLRSLPRSGRYPGGASREIVASVLLRSWRHAALRDAFLKRVFGLIRFNRVIFAVRNSVWFRLCSIPTPFSLRIRAFLAFPAS
jgi:hypothetical protein